jgi:hypothetical protein
MAFFPVMPVSFHRVSPRVKEFGESFSSYRAMKELSLRKTSSKVWPHPLLPLNSAHPPFQVGEVFSEHKTRLSISGWFYAAKDLKIGSNEADEVDTFSRPTISDLPREAVLQRWMEWINEDYLEGGAGLKTIWFAGLRVRSGLSFRFPRLENRLPPFHFLPLLFSP